MQALRKFSGASLKIKKMISMARITLSSSWSSPSDDLDPLAYNSMDLAIVVWIESIHMEIDSLVGFATQTRKKLSPTNWLSTQAKRRGEINLRCYARWS